MVVLRYDLVKSTIHLLPFSILHLILLVDSIFGPRLSHWQSLMLQAIQFIHDNLFSSNQIWWRFLRIYLYLFKELIYNLHNLIFIIFKKSLVIIKLDYLTSQKLEYRLKVQIFQFFSNFIKKILDYIIIIQNSLTLLRVRME